MEIKELLERSVEIRKRYHELEEKSSTLMELEELTLGSLRKAAYEGDVENGSIMSGQIAGLVNEIHNQIENCQKFIEQYKVAIQQKLNSIYSTVNIDPIFLENGIRQLNTLLIKLESKRKYFISAIQQREEIQNELLSINKKIAHLQIAQAYRDYKKQQRDKRTAELNLQDSQKQVENTSNHLKKLKQKKSNAGVAIENINNALE